MTKTTVLPTFSGRGSSHMKLNCLGRKIKVLQWTQPGTCFAFHLCPLSPTPPRQSETHLHSLHRPAEEGQPQLVCSSVCATGSCWHCCLCSLPKAAWGSVNWDYLLCPVTFRIAILLSNLNQIIQDRFADEKIHS